MLVVRFLHLQYFQILPVWSSFAEHADLQALQAIEERRSIQDSTQKAQTRTHNYNNNKILMHDSIDMHGWAEFKRTDFSSQRERASKTKIWLNKLTWKCRRTTCGETLENQEKHSFCFGRNDDELKTNLQKWQLQAPRSQFKSYHSSGFSSLQSSFYCWKHFSDAIKSIHFRFYGQFSFLFLSVIHFLMITKLCSNKCDTPTLNTYRQKKKMRLMSVL